MEAESVKRVFERSIKKHELRYVEFLGDGDTRSYVNAKDTDPGIEIKKIRVCWTLSKKSWDTITKSGNNKKGLGDRGRLTDPIVDRLQNYAGVTIRQNVGDLKSMKSGFLASLFHVASNKDNLFHYPHCPIGPNSWCKCNADRANNTQSYKSGPGLPRNIIYEKKPIFLELSKDSKLEKCLHGKTQNANESFNDAIWERIPKTTFVTLPNLEFGVYDAVANFNIGMKASVLIYEKLNFAPGVHMLKGCNKYNIKKVDLDHKSCELKNDKK